MTGTNTNCAIQLLADATVRAKADYENALRYYQQLSYALGLLRNNV